MNTRRDPETDEITTKKSMYGFLKWLKYLLYIAVASVAGGADISIWITISHYLCGYYYICCPWRLHASHERGL